MMSSTAVLSRETDASVPGVGNGTREFTGSLTISGYDKILALVLRSSVFTTFFVAVSPDLSGLELHKGSVILKTFFQPLK
jgi:hypothetical protein